ncbi:MAG: hypothetical protein QGG40_21295 [Myxococcota bacterium]|nr:hypothetical protein [Myxococcota bacterium]
MDTKTEVDTGTLDPSTGDDTGSPDTGTDSAQDTETGVDTAGVDDTAAEVDSSSVDSGAVIDTGTVDTRDGTYAGTFEIEVVETETGLSAACSEAIDILVDEVGSPQIQGTASCTLSGSLATVAAYQGIDTTQTGDLVGLITEDPYADGEVIVTAMGSEFSEAWSGRFTGNRVEGEFSGSYEYSDPDLGDFYFTYTGGFEGTR